MWATNNNYHPVGKSKWMSPLFKKKQKNLGHAARINFTTRMKFTNSNAFIKKEKGWKSLTLNMSKMLEKEQQNKAKESTWEEIIKIIAEINEIEDIK